MKMTGRERVLCTLAGERPDRPPFYFYCDHRITKAIAKAHNISEKEIADYYDCDSVHFYPAFKPTGRSYDGEDLDLFGNKVRAVTHNGFTDRTVVGPLLEGMKDPEELSMVAWPDETALDMPRCLRDIQWARQTGRAVYGGIWASIFTQSRSLMGEENYLAALYENPAFVKAVIARITECFLRMNRAYMDVCGQYIDIYYFGSDFGTQQSMFISPAMFDEFYVPHMKRIVAQAKGYGKKVMFHSCGSVSLIIDSLISCGVDILDPVQVSARNMDPDSLAARFKGRIAFHGGISTQTTFTSGTGDMIRDDTLHAIHTLGPTGYIVAPDHELIGNVPVSNIDAFAKAVKDAWE